MKMEQVGAIFALLFVFSAAHKDGSIIPGHNDLPMNASAFHDLLKGKLNTLLWQDNSTIQLVKLVTQSTAHTPLKVIKNIGTKKIKQVNSNCTAFMGLMELPCILPFIHNGFVHDRCALLNDDMILAECPVSGDLSKWGVCNKNCYDAGLVETFTEENVAPILVELVMNDDENVCAGALISTKHVLIAAHCLYNGTSIAETGTIMTKSYKSDIFLQNPQSIENIVIHADFNAQTLENDIAIVSLKAHIQLSAFVSTAELLKLPESFVRRQALTFVGWAEKKNLNRKVYHQFPMVFEPPQTCRKILRAIGLGTFVSESQFCANYGKTKLDYSICHGQKTGVLYFEINRSIHLAGILTSRRENCQPYAPSVFVDIQKYLPWIESQTSMNLTTKNKACTTDIFVKNNGNLACGIHIEGQFGISSANQLCQNQGATLPDIRSQEENNFFVRNNKGKIIWLGLLRDNYNSEFKSGGTGLTFTNWAYRSLEKSYSGNNCAYLGLTGEWHEYYCETTINVICEKILPEYSSQ